MSQHAQAYWRKRAAFYAQREGIPVNMFLKQISKESGFNPNAHSPAGAQGIAQIMPFHNVGTDPEKQLAWAARHDAQNYRHYGNWQDVLSVYNSGRPWSQGKRIGETNNYVNSILSGGNPGGMGSPRGGMGGAQGGSGALTGGPSGDFKAQVAALLLSNHGQPSRPGALLGLALQRQQGQAAQQVYGSGAVGGLVKGVGAGKVGKGINELFYDPLGGIKNGHQIGAIGHHSDHVHMSLGNFHSQSKALRQALAMGLHVGEDGVHGDVHDVHVKTSLHYRRYNNKSNLREAADISGSPAQMAKFYRWVANNF